MRNWESGVCSFVFRQAEFVLNRAESGAQSGGGAENMDFGVTE